jgi:formate hydrogenlyase subunit 3/multisubunit Na+/H+ antiporter MnhD subunit
VAAAGPRRCPLLGAAGLLLLVVFGLKAALLPLYFWLPRAYSAASAPVAALFAIMTKVGVYSIVRVYSLIFGEPAGAARRLALAWLWPLALLTILAGVTGALAARHSAKPAGVSGGGLGGRTLLWRTGLVVLGSAERDNARTLAAAGLLSSVLLLVLFAAPVLTYVQATAAQLLDLAPYMQLVNAGETP